MTTGIDVLRSAYTASCDSLRRILDGVGEDEFFWEPVGGCWTVHRRSEDRGDSVDGRGEWVLDYDPSRPGPPPFTTMAWRTVHIAGGNYVRWDYAFGSASLTFDLELPGDVIEATDWLFASLELWTGELAALTDGDLDRIVPSPRGEPWPLHRLFATLITEQVHHGAEISLLRDLFRCRDSLSVRR